MSEDMCQIETLQDLVDHFEEQGILADDVKLGKGFVFYLE